MSLALPDDPLQRAQIAIDSIMLERTRIRGSLQVVLDFAGYDGALRFIDGIRDEFMIEHHGQQPREAG